MTSKVAAKHLRPLRPFRNLRLLLRGALVRLMLVGLRFIILSTAYITPTYVQTV